MKFVGRQLMMLACIALFMMLIWFLLFDLRLITFVSEP